MVLLLALVAAYYHTLDVPFYLDDYRQIRENSLIYNWQGFGALWEYGPLRIVAYLSFILNYQLGQFNPLTYHLFNLLVHWLAAVGVYGFTRSLLRTPRLAGTIPPPALAWLPLFAALLFLLHPLQIQAVTYIVQRLASLAALFYISAMAAFLQARLAGQASHRMLWTGLCLVFAVLAFFTKQNTFTLPFTLLLLEGMFFSTNWRRLAVASGVLAIGLASLWLVFALLFEYNPMSLEAMQRLTRDTPSISRTAYLATQLPVLWIYMKLFYLPVGLHLDYAMSALDGFLRAPVLLAIAGHLMVLGLALWAWRRWPLVTFAILFYYLAHGVESSFIPIADVIFEHRTYLPNLGLCLLTGWFLLAMLPRWVPAKAIASIAVGILLVLGVLTWQRNQLWRDPIALWSQNVEVAPTKARGWASLGKHLLDAKRPAEAARAIEESIQLELKENPTAGVDATVLSNMVTALYLMQRYDQALEMTDRFINHLELTPYFLPAQEGLGRLFAQSGRLAEAESVYVEVLTFDPDNQGARQVLRHIRSQRARESSGRP
jgi:tetratricopeptide (TPR) repeat protein